MLTNVAGYLEVYQQELQQRLAITSPEDTIAADAAFSSTRKLCPAPQLAACLTHHADLMRQLSGVMPLQSVASDLAAVAAAAPSVPVVHAAKAGISAMSKCGSALLLCSAVCTRSAALSILAKAPAACGCFQTAPAHGSSRQQCQTRYHASGTHGRFMHKCTLF